MDILTLITSVQGVLLTGLVGFLILLLLRRPSTTRNFPPGPPSVPILGSLPFLGLTSSRDPTLFMTRLMKTYGSDVIQFWIGKKWVLINIRIWPIPGAARGHFKMSTCTSVGLNSVHNNVKYCLQACGGYKQLWYLAGGSGRQCYSNGRKSGN